jgi:hypothetical protein
MLPIVVAIVVGIFCGTLGLVLGAALAAGGHADDCAECLARLHHQCKLRDFAMEHATNTDGGEIETLRCCVCGREATDDEYAEYCRAMDSPQPPLMTNEPSLFECAGSMSAKMGKR